jgi:cell wall-associated NlpC family hydrolase
MTKAGGYWRIPALLLFLHLLFSSIPTTVSCAEPPAFAVAKEPTLVLNSPDFRSVFGGKDGSTLKSDRCGQVREVEFIALPGTVFRIQGVVKTPMTTIYRVTSSDYPYPSANGFFIDSRTVTTSGTEPPQRQRRLPSVAVIKERLLSAAGTPYVWGGNIRGGLPSLTSLYPPSSARVNIKRWQLTGLDCSGLLYEATEGWTPRNTSSLVDYGKPVPIKGLSPSQIAGKLASLDLIVWKGHVMIVIDQERVIESRLDCKSGQGVVVSPLSQALTELMRQRTPFNDYAEIPVGGKGFVVRRWYDENR